MNVVDKRRDVPNGLDIYFLKQGDCLEEVVKDDKGWHQTGKFFLCVQNGLAEFRTGINFSVTYMASRKFIKIPHAKIVIE